MNSQTQSGFTLVELMVALVIGLLIILGAGQLYLTGFQNFHRIQSLSDKQAVLTFATDILAGDIRRADLSQACPSDEREEFSLYVDGECHHYGLHYYPEDDEVFLRLKVGGGDWQPVVGVFKDLDAFSVIPIGLNGFFEISFDLMAESEEIVFYVQNRTSVFESGAE